LENIIEYEIDMDLKNKDILNEYKDYHPWDQTIPYNFSKKLFYFQNPIQYSNSTYMPLEDYVYNKITDLPDFKKEYYMTKIKNINAHLAVLDRQIEDDSIRHCGEIFDAIELEISLII